MHERIDNLLVPAGRGNVFKIFFVAILLFSCSACGSKSKEELFGEGMKQLNGSKPNAAVVLFRSAL